MLAAAQVETGAGAEWAGRWGRDFRLAPWLLAVAVAGLMWVEVAAQENPDGAAQADAEPAVPTQPDGSGDEAARQEEAGEWAEPTGEEAAEGEAAEEGVVEVEAGDGGAGEVEAGEVEAGEVEVGEVEVGEVEADQTLEPADAQPAAGSDSSGESGSHSASDPAAASAPPPDPSPLTQPPLSLRSVEGQKALAELTSPQVAQRLAAVAQLVEIGHSEPEIVVPWLFAQAYQADDAERQLRLVEAANQLAEEALYTGGGGALGVDLELFELDGAVGCRVNSIQSRANWRKIQAEHRRRQQAQIPRAFGEAEPEVPEEAETPVDELHEGDVILAIDGRSLPLDTEKSGVAARIRRFQPGAFLPLRIRRGEEDLELRLELLNASPLSRTELAGRRQFTTQPLGEFLRELQLTVRDQLRQAESAGQGTKSGVAPAES